MIDAEITRTANKTPMFWHSFNAIQLVGDVRHEEGLDAAIVKDVPNTDHTFVVCRDKAVELR